MASLGSCSSAPSCQDEMLLPKAVSPCSPWEG